MEKKGKKQNVQKPNAPSVGFCNLMVEEFQGIVRLVPGNSAGDLFGMVKSDPFKGYS